MLPRLRLSRLFVFFSFLMLMGLASRPASAQLDFENVYVGRGKELVLTYTCYAPPDVGLFVTQIGIVGTDAAKFTVTQDGMTGGPYFNGQEVSVTLRFAPDTPGIKNANFTGRVVGTNGLAGTFSTTPLVGAGLKLSLTQLSAQTFVTTDAIALRASVGAPVSDVPVLWTVEGGGAASGITGFPTDAENPSDGSGISAFSFVPSTNTPLVRDRRTRWTAGSRAPNPAISFEVTAKIVLDGEEFKIRLSETNLGPLSQDETDRLRQEYYDYNIAVPGRGDVVASLGAGYNEGNYGVQLSVDLPGHYSRAVAAYRGRQVSISMTVNGQVFNNVPVTIPANAPVTIPSGYRNPQRNRAVGSQFPDSRHTRGRALDLVPSVVQVMASVTVNGQTVTQRVTLGLHQTLYPALHAAASTVGTAIAEQSATPVPVGDSRENHIHVQW